MTARRAARLSLAAALLVLASASARAEDPKAPRISVEPTVFDFGKTLPGKTLRKEFTLKNFGDAELVIENVSTTCGCTAALAPDTRLKPGAAAPLRVTLETRSYSGRIERQVLVRSNDAKTPLLTVTISATVEAPAGK